MKPRKSVWFAVPYAKRSLDVGLWDGEEKDGKVSGSKVSLRLKRDEERNNAGGPANPGESVFLHPADALKLAGVLQHSAVAALENDSEKRRAYWRQAHDESSGAPQDKVVSLRVPLPA